jgi:hypothetical protein
MTKLLVFFIAFIHKHEYIEARIEVVSLSQIIGTINAPGGYCSAVLNSEKDRFKNSKNSKI